MSKYSIKSITKTLKDAGFNRVTGKPVRMWDFGKFKSKYDTNPYNEIGYSISREHNSPLVWIEPEGVFSEEEKFKIIYEIKTVLDNAGFSVTPHQIYFDKFFAIIINLSNDII